MKNLTGDNFQEEVGKCRSLEKAMTETFEEVQKEKVKVAFVGRTSSGKSTLINSLLGEEIFPAGIGRTTMETHEIFGGDAQEYTIVTGIGQEKSFETAQFLKQNLLENSSNGTGIKFFLPKDKHKFLQSNLIILDTPGLGYSSETDEGIANACRGCRIFVIVINGESALGSIERNFIKMIQQNHFALELIFVFAHMDKVRQNKVDNTKEHHFITSRDLAKDLLLCPSVDVTDAYDVHFADKSKTFVDGLLKAIVERSGAVVTHRRAYAEKSRSIMLDFIKEIDKSREHNLERQRKEDSKREQLNHACAEKEMQMEEIKRKMFEAQSKLKAKKTVKEFGESGRKSKEMEGPLEKIWTNWLNKTAEKDLKSAMKLFHDELDPINNEREKALKEWNWNALKYWLWNALKYWLWNALKYWLWKALKEWNWNPFSSRIDWSKAVNVLNEHTKTDCFDNAVIRNLLKESYENWIKKWPSIDFHAIFNKNGNPQFVELFLSFSWYQELKKRVEIDKCFRCISHGKMDITESVPEDSNVDDPIETDGCNENTLRMLEEKKLRLLEEKQEVEKAIENIEAKTKQLEEWKGEIQTIATNISTKHLNK